METETQTTTCGDTFGSYVCTLPPHSVDTDHCETRRTVWAGIPYVAAFWNYGQGITGLNELVRVR